MKTLIAEDDLFIREGLKDILDAEGYECILAADGEEALQLYESAEPALVLLDIMMPKMDGYSVCKAIRKLNEDVPVVFITAKSEEIDQVVGLELGADDYIKKPFGNREVVARIRAVTRRYLRMMKQVNSTSSNESQPKVDFALGDLQVHPDELRAVRGGATIELSLRDVKVLELLRLNQGKIVDRDMLFNYCWGRDYLPSSRTLDQHISKLRKLVEVDPKQPVLIKTVHGVGYRFDIT